MEKESVECLKRTLGDGMDNSLINFRETGLSYNTDLKLNINLSSKHQPSFKPVEPKTKIFSLVPKYCPKERKQPKCLIKKRKEPKFVPYEPYKGATESIMPRKSIIKVQKSSKNNVEIQELVTQMSELRASELSKSNSETECNEESIMPRKQWEKEKNAYETDIKNLRETNSHLENQLKFQAQVNSELKTLLVAAVGEDLESRVQHLTEDKLQLARALLNSAHHLTSHQEQTEWLSGQCEVWRSKFLASSLMVEELARWKSALTSRMSDLQETIKSLLEERKVVQRKSLMVNCNLSCVLRNLRPESDCPTIIKNGNILELSNINCSLGETIAKLSSVKIEDATYLFDQYLRLPQYTIPETFAMKLLQNPVTISSKQDALCNALMGAAISLSGEQLYLQHPSNHATCCAHCTGEIKNI